MVRAGNVKPEYGAKARGIKKAPEKALFYGCDLGRISKTGSTLVGTLAWVLFAAGVRTALQADLLAAAGRDGVALGRDWLWGADVGFDSDFLGHGELRLKMA